ncbi:MAG: hypothetical protein ISP42_00295 [Alphaproteobacteria bacterium]|jgi:hypothetical protein|nr:hypothetical protein [Alphaproteobacteria bacterium]
MHRIARFVLLIWIVGLAGAAPLRAETVSLQDQACVQAAPGRFLDATAEANGSFVWLDSKTARKQRLYPSDIHPKIVPFGRDLYVCLTMLTGQREALEADFLMRRIEAGWMVVDILVRQRDLMKQALQEL